MDTQSFVEAIKLVVAEQTARGVFAQLEAPAGRKPADDVMARSKMFHTLSDAHKDFIKEILFVASDHAAYNFLCVLDGVVAIESVEEKGSLELHFIKGGQSTLLNPTEIVELNSLYKNIT